MTTPPVDRLARLVTALAVVLLAALATVQLLTDVEVAVAFSLAAVVAAVAAPVPAVAAVAAAATLAAAVTSGEAWAAGAATSETWWFRTVVCAAICTTSVVSAVVRDRREARLRRMTVIAETVQRAVLRAMPTTVGDVGFAARYVSASEDALIGGDLYEALATPYGVRVIVGDVRGKGMEAVQLASSVLGAFRAAAFAQPTLLKVAAALDGAVLATAGDEDFVTALIAEFRDDQTVAMANCGHHPPLIVLPDGTSRLADTGPTASPLGLGLGAKPALAVEAWPSGARMLLYTDGLVEARDDKGEFFPLGQYAHRAAGGTLEEALGNLVADLRSHTDDRLDDDMALVLAERR